MFAGLLSFFRPMELSRMSIPFDSYIILQLSPFSAGQFPSLHIHINNTIHTIKRIRLYRVFLESSSHGQISTKRICLYRIFLDFSSHSHICTKRILLYWIFLESSTSESIEMIPATTFQGPAGGVASNSRLWPENKEVLVVHFLNGNPEEKYLVWRVVSEQYNSIPMHLKFVFPGDWNARHCSDIRILFTNGDSSSCVGRDAENCHPSEPTMRLDRDKRGQEMVPIILHEFGHALGMGHEHQHPYYAAEWNYGALQISRRRSYQHLHRNYERVDLRTAILTAYDPCSIMHYEILPGETLNYMPRVYPNTELSNGDRELLIALYPW